MVGLLSKTFSTSNQQRRAIVRKISQNYGSISRARKYLRLGSLLRPAEGS
jgi:hypothetical protein